MTGSNVRGLGELKRNLLKAGVGARVAMAAGLVAFAEDVMARSKMLCPVDTGTLRGSGYVSPPEFSGTKVELELGYGGAASDYAVIQHERVDYRHPSGQAKFLEQPLKEQAQSMPLKLATAVKSSWAVQK